MVQNKQTVYRYQVHFNAPFPLPKTIEVVLDCKPNYNQMLSFIAHLRDKAIGHAGDQNISPFFQSLYSETITELKCILANLKASKGLMPEYKSGKVTIKRTVEYIKGFDE